MIMRKIRKKNELKFNNNNSNNNTQSKIRSKISFNQRFAVVSFAYKVDKADSFYVLFRRLKT